jgi:transglutaminase-like putative cysteine protease
MREANWDEIFQKRAGDGTEQEERLSAVIPWEEWLTLGIVMVIFLACISSIQNADWVDDMPSMYPIGFAGLIIGYGLSRVRWLELLLHPLALLAGATLVYLQLMAIVPGGSVVARTDQLVDRMHIWWSALTQGGISSDDLPFITLLLVLTFLGAYISSWAVFRWRNVWIALVPSGFSLLWNISFIPGQFSFAFVVFCFGAVLLVMRMNVQQKQEEWNRQGIRYPEFMSISVLHATFWVALGLIAIVLVMPRPHRSETAGERWEDFTSPITQYFTPYARVFVGVNAKKPINIHGFEDALPFQGKITLSGREAVEIDVELTPEMAQFLREQSFDEYTSAGWKINVNGVPLDAGDRTLADDAGPTGRDAGSRQEVTINVTIKNDNDEHLFSLGQPLESSVPAEARVGEDLPDVSSLEPAENLSNEDTYTVTGSVAIPSVEMLAVAGQEYPSWVTERYLQVPADLPERVGTKAEEVTRGAETPYEQAAAVEQFLRTFPNDFNIPTTPPGRDTVDFFLFDIQRGYFDYHASAMAVMLRTLGVPARVATGYVIDPVASDGEGNSYRLTQKNAYAWPEVYFPGIGWVEFSPSPAQPVIQRRIDTPAPPEEPVAPGTGTTGLRDEFELGGLAPPAPLVPLEEESAGTARGFPLLIALAVAGAVIVALAAAGRFAWEYGMGGLSHPSRLWEKTLRLAALGKVGARASETPREFAARLRRDVEGAGAAGYVAAKYEGARFGQKQLSEEETEKLDAAWASLRNALLRRVLRLRSRI